MDLLSSENIGIILLIMQLSYIISAESGAIKSLFIDGDLTFLWTPKSSYQNVSVACDNNIQTMANYTRDEYIAYDVLNCTEVNISVHTFSDYGYEEMSTSYKPKITFVSEGDRFKIILPGPHGIFNNVYKLTSKSSMKIDYTSVDFKRYTLRRTHGNLYLEVLNVTTSDAGYYSVGYNASDSKTRHWVILVVFGRPTKPIVMAKIKFSSFIFPEDWPLKPISKGTISTPTCEKTVIVCSGDSTSAPLFYKKFPLMKYFWYVNNTSYKGIRNQELDIRFIKKHLQENVSCSAQEYLMSKSDVTQLKPLYISWPVIYTVLNGDVINDSKIIAKDGDDVTIVCKIEGYPIADVFITKESKAGVKLPGYLLVNLYHYKFTHGIRYNDSDTYICNVSNEEFGDMSAHVQLIVK
ncbi:uncharacterized protein LOC134259421, partial [Saccostrea cucullata]|uniref:uncharacterized protein LOC134259421 n=1 Tax=Saccostrea cuccullata TaxID=36930 RepID=UPI002ED40E08